MDDVGIVVGVAGIGVVGVVGIGVSGGGEGCRPSFPAGGAEQERYQKR